MKLFHAQFKNNVGQTIDVGDKVIVVRCDGTVEHGVYIGFTQQRWNPKNIRPYVLADRNASVPVYSADKTITYIPGKVRISSSTGKVYKLA